MHTNVILFLVLLKQKFKEKKSANQPTQFIQKFHLKATEHFLPLKYIPAAPD